MGEYCCEYTCFSQLILFWFAGKAQGNGTTEQAWKGLGRDNHGNGRGTGRLNGSVFEFDVAEADDIAGLQGIWGK